MKRFVTALLAAAASLTLAVPALAAPAPTPKQIYDALAEESVQMDSMDTDISAAISLGYGGEYMNMNMYGNMKITDTYSGNMKYIADLTMETGVPGTAEYEKETVKMFYTDGYIYEEVGGDKIKIEMPMESYMEMSKAMTANKETANMVKNITIRQDGELFTLDFAGDLKKANSFLKKYLNSEELSALKSLEMDLKFNYLTGSYTFDKDFNITNMNMKMMMDFKFLGETFNLGMIMDAKINNPGQPVEITIPSTDGYKTMEEYVNSAVSAGGQSGSGPAAESY